MNYYDLEEIMGVPEEDYETDYAFEISFRIAEWDGLEVMYYIDYANEDAVVAQITVTDSKYVDNLGGYVGCDFEEFKANLPECEIREWSNHFMVIYYFVYRIVGDRASYSEEELYSYETEFQLEYTNCYKNIIGSLQYEIENGKITSITVFCGGDEP